MNTILKYLNEIDKWRDTLVEIVQSNGIETYNNEKLNTLIPKVQKMSPAEKTEAIIDCVRVNYKNAAVTDAIIGHADPIEEG